jgi:hypothetical protein
VFRRSRGIFHADAFRHSAQPALAGEEAARAGGARGAAAHRRARISKRNCRISSRRSMPSTATATSRCSQHKYRVPIFLAVAIGMFNQLSGINAILYYLNDIFRAGGFQQGSSDLQAVAIGATNLLFTMIAMSVIDRIGRKTLLLVGSVGLAISLAGVTAILAMHTASGVAGLAAGGLHRLICLLAGRRDLGLSQRSVPQPRAGQGPEPRAASRIG